MFSLLVARNKSFLLLLLCVVCFGSIPTKRQTQFLGNSSCYGPKVWSVCLCLVFIGAGQPCSSESFNQYFCVSATLPGSVIPVGQNQKMWSLSSRSFYLGGERDVKINTGLDFPGGAVVTNLPANAGDTASSPCLGSSHMPRSN